jgi:hypothetical protein
VATLAAMDFVCRVPMFVVHQLVTRISITVSTPAGEVRVYMPVRWTNDIPMQASVPSSMISH